MTSKEALKFLFRGTYNNPEDYTEEYKIIAKDLEILKILKQNTILYEDNTQGSGYINSNGDFHCETYTHYFLNGIKIDKETYFKLKEWLENDTRRD